jgi:hypothetical protein
MELSDTTEKIPSDTTRDRSRYLPTSSVTTPPQAYTGQVADCIIMRNYKWLFVNVPGYKNSFFTATEFLNSYRDGTSASVFSGIML